MSYGNFNLQRDDHDGNIATNHPPRWGGVDDPQSPSGSIAQTPQSAGGATIAIPQHVKQLQLDLRMLGFLMLDTADGVFGRHSEWAVREFQIYAGMTHVAKGTTNALPPNTGLAPADIAALGTAPGMTPPASYYVASLQQTTNSARYDGPISGVVNKKTRDALDHWLGQDYRCPVIVEAWTMQHGQRHTTFANGVNVWRIDQLTSAMPRFFYRDFTKYYSYPIGKSAAAYQVLGTYLSFSTYGGPASTVPNHTWTEAEMLPERLIGTGKTLSQLQADINGAMTSTYRIVRAAAEQECMGCFDSINAYDDAMISLGPCHWTMGLMPQNGYSNGELPGFLAYLLFKNEGGYLKAFGNFGLYPSDNWVASNQGPLWNDHQHKYTGWIRAHQDSTSPSQAPHQVNQLALVNRDPSEADYYKSWHWFFRMVMAGRAVDVTHHAMWDMVRYRVRDVLNIAIRVQSGGLTLNARLGDVFTSEKAVAILLRWHIFRPAHVSGSTVRDSIASAIQGSSGVNWNVLPSQWQNSHEIALTDQLLIDATAVNPTQGALASWPNYQGRAARNYVLNNQLGSLQTDRNSFILDDSGL